jgi:cation diffusion facilitator CzcD-associated flavoprotein CzcO
VTEFPGIETSMHRRVRTAIIGAGPFGLSVAAHAPDAVVFGASMQTWRTDMQPDMLLWSAWDDTSLCAPSGRGTIDEWARETGRSPQQPLPLSTFLEYAAWFDQEFVEHPHEREVALVTATNRGLKLETVDGIVVEAERAVIAVGAQPFRHAPDPLARLVGNGVQHASAALGYRSFRDRRVVIVGAGQGGLEAAAKLAQAGTAGVEVITRGAIRWFAGREPTSRGPVGRRIHMIAYPSVGYGPPIFNRLATAPRLLERSPETVRRMITRRALRAGGPPWIRPLFDGHVFTTTHVEVTGAEVRCGELRLLLSDGSERRCDDVLLATGYRFALDRLRFLDPPLGRGVKVSRGWPVLDACFRSTERRLLFVGFPAEGRFGPTARFILGTRFTCDRVRAVV